MALGRKKNPVDARRAGSVDAAIRRSLRAAVAGDWPTAETWLERIVEVDLEGKTVEETVAKWMRDNESTWKAWIR